MSDLDTARRLLADAAEHPDPAMQGALTARAQAYVGLVLADRIGALLDLAVRPVRVRLKDEPDPAETPPTPPGGWRESRGGYEADRDRRRDTERQQRVGILGQM